MRSDRSRFLTPVLVRSDAHPCYAATGYELYGILSAATPRDDLAVDTRRRICAARVQGLVWCVGTALSSDRGPPRAAACAGLVESDGAALQVLRGEF